MSTAIGSFALEPFGEFAGSVNVMSDLLSLVCGEQLGAGIARSVYEFKPDPTCVIKVELGAQSFQNIAEWQFWSTAAFDPKARPWLAPCIQISASGMWLLQKRTQPATVHDFPERVPTWLTDLKPANFGMLDGRFVCHDYGLTNVNPPNRLRKAKWNG